MHYFYAILLTCVMCLLTASSGPLPAPAALNALGWRLLGERRLDADGTTSCLDCHQPARGYTDGLPTARPGGLNTPPLWGLAQRSVYGWRRPGSTSLEAAALRPLADPTEQGPLRPATLERLRRDSALYAAYRAAFPNSTDLVTWEQTAAALAEALRSIPAPPSTSLDPVGRSEAAARGQALFSEIGCGVCHRGPQFASDSYHSVGVAPPGAPDAGRVRVPSLRGLHMTAPYFHDGSATTVREVVLHYAEGGRGRGGTPPSDAVVPVQLTEAEINDLVAFLAGL